MKAFHPSMYLNSFPTLYTLLINPQQSQARTALHQPSEDQLVSVSLLSVLISKKIKIIKDGGWEDVIYQ